VQNFVYLLGDLPEAGEAVVIDAAWAKSTRSSPRPSATTLDRRLCW